MRIKYSKKFQKQLKKSPKKIQNKFFERLDIFISNPSHPILNNHELTGSKKGIRSINITADWRALYENNYEGSSVFVLFGTHSQLYK